MKQDLTLVAACVLLGLITVWKRLYDYFTSVGAPDYATLSGVPAPKPLKGFDIDSAKARPYRPFRWEYHQNMALSKMEPDWWLELESTYRERIPQRQQLYADHGRAILDAMPGSEQACKELLEMVVAFLCARYPTQFQTDWRSGLFHNRILGTSSNIRTADPLHFLLDNVPEDFAVMQKDEETGLYVLRAAVSCSAIGWKLQEKMGKALHEIHEPIPDYKEKMQYSMDRGTWGFGIGEILYAQSGDPRYSMRGTQNPDLDVKDICLRVEWQTLRRLPKTQAIVFNFRQSFTPVTQLQNEPYIPKLVAKVLRDGKKSLLEHKATYHVEHKLLPALDMWAEEQEDKGWVPRGWKERTLDESPYYPGWEKDKVQ
ncbi:hypothetical protein DXG01_015798 [Tephrocybe rancida]|nr:hypothetical protein DXG01_015798 [Tephrocybe rancida]